MAGRGPAPAENRRRRNEPARGDWVDLPPLEHRVLPELPAPPPLRVRSTGEEFERPWSDRTVAAWEAWAQDPVTGIYGPAEIAAAVELAYVMEAFVRGTGAPNEVRLRMDGLGLSPKGKRDLRYRTASEDQQPSAPRQARSSAGKRRSRLSVVK